MESVVRSRPIVIQRDAVGQKAQMLQQRLLLLNHSSKCTVPDDEVCPVSRHCGQFKLLWKHILACKDNACKVMHCLSSRYVLSHYAKCDDCYCSICPRVRESAKRESCESMDAPSSAKKPRSSYWWASETFVNFSKTVTVNTRDFTRPHPQNVPPPTPTPTPQPQHPYSTQSSPQPTSMPTSVEKLNFNLTQLSINSNFPTELPPRRPEPRPEPRESEPPSALDLLATAATTSAMKPPLTRPRASSGASTATAGSSYTDGGLPSISPSFHSSSSSSSALFVNLQAAPFVSVAHHLGSGNSFSSASVAQEEYASNLSSFSSVCSYRESNAGSPYMTPQLSPVGSFKEESKFKF